LTKHTLRKKISEMTETLWFNKLWEDQGQENGNKLRTYRQFKITLNTETYVTQLYPDDTVARCLNLDPKVFR